MPVDPSFSNLASSKKLTTLNRSLAREINPARGVRDEVSSSHLKRGWGPTVQLQNVPAVHRKPTSFIGLNQARNVLQALAHAEHIGVLPNRHITIDWEQGEVYDQVRATGRFLKLMKDCLRKRGLQTSHVWVRENGVVLGQHTHLLLHVPAQEVSWFNRSRRRWLKSTGLVLRKGVWKSCAIRGSSKRADQSSSDLHRHNVRIVARYVLKHCSRKAARSLKLRTAGPSLTVGKRVSTSQNIGLASRGGCKRCSGSHGIKRCE